ncbi:MAG TPA: hypothetical protein DF613_11765 [Lachnospiraceae bacterium]|nr:hypothetical protein [Lachnospiraceae bacterium]
MRALTVVLALFAGDGAIKKYMCHHLREGEKKPVCGGWLVLRRLKNPGAVLGFGKGRQRELNLASGGMLAALLARLACIGGRGGHGLEKTALTLIAGGGLSNLTDRVTQGYVDDYVSIARGPEKLQKLVFNLSDILVFAGAVLFVVNGGFTVGGKNK